MIQFTVIQFLGGAFTLLIPISGIIYYNLKLMIKIDTQKLENKLDSLVKEFDAFKRHENNNYDNQTRFLQEILQKLDKK